MKRLLPILLAAAACSDSGVGPNRAESLAIEIEAERVVDAALAVGDSVQLRASIEGGQRPGSPSNPAWMSEAPEVATVSAGGLVRGVGEGTTRVIATAGALADTIFVTVLAGPTPADHCGPARADAISLALGQSYTTSAAAAPKLCLQGGSEYIVVPFHAAQEASTMRVEVLIESAAAPASPTIEPARASDPQPQLSPVLRDGSDELHRRLREREKRDLTPLISRLGPRVTPRFAISPAAIPVVGDFMNVNVNSEVTCGEAITRRARVAAVSARAVVLTDESNPASGFTTADLTEFARLFDEVIHPTVVGNFGEPTDIDGNGRVILLFTRAVNEMTPPKSDSYTAGFFFARDLFPTSERDGFKGCAGSNTAEMLYLLVPDPNGEINGNTRSRNFVGERTPGVMAHELQHLINASRRLRTLGLEDWSEEFWLNEGLSHAAEELTFYTASKLKPRSNINATTLRLGFGTPLAYDQFQANNFNRYSAYLRDAESTSPINGTSLSTRGAIWAFLRYAADRIPNSEPAFWKGLIDNPATGYANLADAIDASPLSWIHDWQVAAYVHQLTPVPPRYQQPSWNFRSVMSALTNTGGIYPLRVRAVFAGARQEEKFDLAAGGAGYIRISGRTTDRFTITTTSGGSTPPKNLRLAVIRFR